VSVSLRRNFSLRVLYFSRDYTTHDRRFLKALANTEHQIYYLRLEQSGHRFEERSLPRGIEPVEWAGGRQRVDIWDGMRLLGDLKRVIREVNPSLIQAGPLQRSALLVAIAGFRPLVSTSWGYDLLHDARRNFLWAWATRFTLQRSAVMVGDCDEIRRLAISFGMPEERIVTFPWGVDIKLFNPGGGNNSIDQHIEATSGSDNSLVRDRLGWGKKAFVLISTRGWEYIYGVDVLAHAFIQVARQRPEVRLLMLGEGSLAGILREIFTQGGVLEKVHFVRQVSQTQLPDYYRAADLYLSASHSDGTSISLLEAMACARPVLVSDIPGNREWVTPGKQGWWFTDGDSSALALAIMDAMEDRQRLIEMGWAARRLVEERADWEKSFPELLRAYELAISVQ